MKNSPDNGAARQELDAVPDSLVRVSRLRADSVKVVHADLSFVSSREALEHMRQSPEASRYEAGILPRMAEENLDYCQKLLNSNHSRFIVVDKQRMKVILYDRYGVEERSYGMACAKNYGTKHKRADSRTPEGFFSVEGIYDSTEWLFTDDDGNTSQKKGQFGPRFIRLSTPVSSQIGIHGTCAPWSIGGRSSHGCIRIKNENILELVDMVEVGMPVIISPGRRDIEVNVREGYDIPVVSTLLSAPSIRSVPSNEGENDSSPSYPETVTHKEEGSDSLQNSHRSGEGDDSVRDHGPLKEQQEQPDTVVEAVFS